MTEEALIADRLDELRKEMELRFTGEFVDNAVNRLDSASNFLRRIANQPPAQDGLVDLLKQARNVLAGSGAESGYCMCGDPVQSHSLGSGHAPVDSHAYYAGRLVEQIDAALASLGEQHD